MSEQKEETESQARLLRFIAEATDNNGCMDCVLLILVSITALASLYAPIVLFLG